MGSDDDMGQSMSAYRHLIQEGPAFYRLRYCP
jgi:hypothetical protein